jgi:hypothetical protein
VEKSRKAASAVYPNYNQQKREIRVEKCILNTINIDEKGELRSMLTMDDKRSLPTTLSI